MSLFDFGSGAEGQARRGMRTSRWNPGMIGLEGFGTVQGVKTNANKGPVNYSGTFDPTQASLRQGFLGLAGMGMDQLAQPLPNVGGFGGISPEMLAEFGLSNQDIGLPSQFYDQAGFDQGLGNARTSADMAWQEYQNLAGSGDAGYGHWLDVMRQASKPYEDRFLQGGMDDQFLKGILASSAGQYQTQGMMDSLNTADLNRQLGAFGMSQEALNGALSRATGAQGMFNGMEGDAANRGFLINQLQGSRAQDRFGRAMNLFGLGQQGTQLQRANAAQLLGIGTTGMSAQDQQMLSSLGLLGNLSSQRSGANSGAAAIMSNYNNNALGNFTNLLTGTMNAGAEFDPRVWGFGG